MKKLNVVQVFNFLALMVLIFLLSLFFSPVKRALKEVPFVKHIITEQEDALYRTGGKTLYFIKPGFKSIGQYILKGNRIETLDGLLNYYSKAAYYFPDNADIQYMNAFVNAQNGNESQAIASFKESQRLNTGFFWTYYNLGMVLLKKKDYVGARINFRQALNADVKQTVERVYRSGVFRDLLQETKLEPRDLLTHIQLAYENAQKKILLCYFYEEDYVKLFAESTMLIQEQGRTDVFYFFMMGAALVELQQYEAGVGVLQKVAAGEKTFSEAYSYLGKALRKLGHNDLASKMDAQADILLRNNITLKVQVQTDLVVF